MFTVVALSPSASVFYAPWHFFAKFFVARRGRGNVLKREGGSCHCRSKVCSETRVKWANYRGGRAMMPARPDEDPKELVVGGMKVGMTATYEKAHRTSSSKG